MNDIASAVTRLKKEGVEDSMMAVLAYDDWQALGSNVVSDNASLTDEGGGVYRNGWGGRIAGIPTQFTQQLQPLVSERDHSGAIFAMQKLKFRTLNYVESAKFYFCSGSQIRTDVNLLRAFGL